MQRQAVDRTDVVWALLMAVAVWVVYQINGSVLPSNDITVNVELPANFLKQRGLSFSPQDEPSMFVWQHGEDQHTVWSWNGAAPDGRTWDQWRQEGLLEVKRPRYYLARSVDPERRGYVSTYGIGAGLVALPAFAVRHWLDLGFLENRAAKWLTAKWVASACVALSVAILFVTARPIAGRCLAVGIALSFGFGTSVWSMSSQALWQSGPSVLFLSLAVFCLSRISRSAWWWAACGASTGCAVLCRESAILFAAIVACHAMLCGWTDVGSRRSWSSLDAFRPLLMYCLAALPFAIALGYYNWYFLGSPFVLAKTQAAHFFAEAKLGNPNLWQTPFLVGFAGLLCSPSRGVLVYSPLLIFTLWGAVVVWKKKRFRDLRPLTIVALLFIVMYAKYFDWHSGWSFGSRYTTDLLPMLTICSAAVARHIARKRHWLVLFVLALSWSVFVQILGAFAYNVVGWNNRPGYLLMNAAGQPVQLVVEHELAKRLANVQGLGIRTVRMNVDLKPFRNRLWSLSDSQLVYYATHFREARQTKIRNAGRWLQKLDQTQAVQQRPDDPTTSSAPTEEP